MSANVLRNSRTMAVVPSTAPALSTPSIWETMFQSQAAPAATTQNQRASDQFGVVPPLRMRELTRGPTNEYASPDPPRGLAQKQSYFGQRPATEPSGRTQHAAFRRPDSFYDLEKTEPLLGHRGMTFKDYSDYERGLDGDIDVDLVAKAAWQLEDTQQDRLVECYPSDPDARAFYFRVASADTLYHWALVLLLIVSFTETPSWCHQGHSESWFWDYVDAGERCRVEGVPVEHLTLSGIEYIPLGWGMVVEVICVSALIYKLLLERHLQMKYFEPLDEVYIDLKLVRFGLAMAFLELADSFYFLTYRPHYRFAFISRTGFLCMLPGVRRLGNVVLHVVNQFFAIASFFAGTILFFAWIVVTIFQDMDEMAPTGVPVNFGLSSLRHSLNTIAIAGATEDFKFVLVPTYTTYRASGLLWLVFLVIVHVLLLNLVLDTLVAAYMSYAEGKEEEEMEDKIGGIFAAYDTLFSAKTPGGHLQGRGEVSLDLFLAFVEEFSQSPRTRRIKQQTAEIMFRTVDKNLRGHVSKREFCDLCGVMQYDFWAVRKYSILKDWCPCLWNSGCFSAFVQFMDSGKFESLMNFVLTLNLVLVVTESTYDLRHLPEPEVLEDLELYFSFIYVGEVFLKLTVYSFRHYWSPRANQFDFFTTWLLLGSSLVDKLATQSGDVALEVKRYANVLRLLRLLRVLKQLKNLPAFALMLETVIRLVSASKDILSLFGVVIFFFTLWSVQLWGGVLYEGNPLLKETEWSEHKHFVFNFNDPLMAFGVWVVHTISEYMPELPEAIELADVRKPWTWVVFVIYYVFAVSIVFELVMAFTIEVFIKLRKKAMADQAKAKANADGSDSGSDNDETFRAIKELEEVFDQQEMTLHYRIVGDVSTQDKIVEALEAMGDELEHDLGGGHGGHGGGHGFTGREDSILSEESSEDST
eukprot:TRINITY_DN14675_c0_g1_i1.p1 TRINITY_DN14675_c0_g1~~TRINITY_DN14675_c0_g1_i1.p1  ORF type:complete len:924 (-),score=174.45 TRINITY_DN14675_c0_g1_i1:288-3059(-)